MDVACGTFSVDCNSMFVPLMSAVCHASLVSSFSYSGGEDECFSVIVYVATVSVSNHRGMARLSSHYVQHRMRPMPYCCATPSDQVVNMCCVIRNYY